jgi:hypothetical protein
MTPEQSEILKRIGRALALSISFDDDGRQHKRPWRKSAQAALVSALESFEESDLKWTKIFLGQAERELGL